jgi:non-specific protein-tyrosine kinase
MDLKVYLAILKGNLWVIAATLLVTLIVAVGGTYLITPVYTATTTLRIAAANSGVVSYSDYMYADRLLNTYVRIAASGPVLAELAARLGIAAPPQVKVATVPNTELIQVSVDSADPGVAQMAADTLAEIMAEQGRTLYSGGVKSQVEILSEQLAQAETELKDARQQFETNPSANADELETQSRAIELKERTYATLLDQYEQARLREAMRANNITVVEPASLPLKPTQPRPLVNLGLGALAGLIGGVGLAFLFENLNGRVHTSSQVEAITGLPVLARAPMVGRADTLAPMGNDLTAPAAPFREAIRRLRANVITRSQSGRGAHSLRPHTLLVVSAEPSEGKSTIAAHLALALAQAGKSVLLLDADMRVPGLHSLLDLPNSNGLSNLLKNTTQLDDAIQRTRQAGLDVITSGPQPQAPSELLGSTKMINLLEDLNRRYDFVLVDTPAFLPVADAAILAPLADAVLLVVRRAFIRQEALREICKQLDELHVQTLGVVVNQAEPAGNYAYYRGH